MGITRIERETTIIFNDDESIANVWTCSPVMMRKLDKLAETYPNDYRCTRYDEDGYSKRYEVKKRYIRFGKPASEAQKERGRKVAEAMAKRRAKQNEE